MFQRRSARTGRRYDVAGEIMESGEGINIIICQERRQFLRDRKCRVLVGCISLRGIVSSKSVVVYFSAPTPTRTIRENAAYSCLTTPPQSSTSTCLVQPETLDLPNATCMSLRRFLAHSTRGPADHRCLTSWTLAVTDVVKRSNQRYGPGSDCSPLVP